MARVIKRRGPRGPYRKAKLHPETDSRFTGNYLSPDAERRQRAILVVLADIAKQNSVVVPLWPHDGVISKMTRTIGGGRLKFLDYVVKAVLEGAETAKTWWATWEQLTPSYQLKVSFDDVCAASGVTPSEFVGMIVATSMEHGRQVTEFVATALQPSVVRKMGKSALRIGGEYADLAMKDRHLFLQGRGFLPVPRNATMTVNVSAHASSNAKAAAAASSEPSMPSFMADMSSLQGPKDQIQKALTGEVVEDED